MIISDPLTFMVGAVVGVVVALGVLVFLRRNRIVEKSTDPIYYKIFSKKKENLRKIVEYLEKNKKITSKQTEELVGASPAVAKRCLDELKKENLVVQKGKASGVHYELKK